MRSWDTEPTLKNGFPFLRRPYLCSRTSSIRNMQGILKLIKTPSPWIPQNMTSQNRVKTLKPTSLSNTNNKKVRFVSELPSRDFVPGAGEPLVFGLPWLPGTHGDWTHLCCGDQLWYKLWRGISMRCLLEKPDAHRLGGGEDLNKKTRIWPFWGRFSGWKEVLKNYWIV